ncbi:hypothetical protein [Kitasatospora mediocidica]|uniref:hypothetical protein n=1 Tax=Kitasatospora mediocidica TaxID=58352 RepID=UPI0012FB0ADE|nr:hypothetical protein [Kitasatospora mediocidica]
MFALRCRRNDAVAFAAAVNRRFAPDVWVDGMPRPYRSTPDSVVLAAWSGGVLGAVLLGCRSTPMVA